MDRHPASMRIRAVAFDLGGVFFPWPDREYFTRWEERLRLQRGSLDALLWHGPDIEAANVGALSAEEYFSRCAFRLGTSEGVVREMIEHAFAPEIVDEELVTFARSLRPRLRVAALTNTWSFGRRLAGERGIADLFDVFVGSAEAGVRKPDSRVFELLLRKLELQAAEVAFVDDTRENLESARSLGFPVIEHLSTARTIRELEQLIGASPAASS